MEEEILYQYGRYAVLVIDDHMENSTAVPGYGVVNTATGVTEFSHTLLFQCLKWARICEIEVKKIENLDEEPTEEEQWPKLNTIN